jgi:hypothetical protein
MTAPVFHRADELKVEGYTLQVALPATFNLQLATGCI